MKGDPLAPGNSYGGIYKVSAGRSFTISKTWTTQVGLPSGSRYGEYFEALKNASSYKIEGNRLRIFYNNKTKALEFKAP